MADPPAPAPATDGFAERLTAAMAGAGDADGPISDARLAALLSDAGVGVTASYVYMLRTGRRTNAGPELLMALAAVLRVPVASLAFGPVDQQDAARWTEALTWCANPGASAIMRGLVGLSPGSRQAITALVTRFCEIEGLGPVAQP